jgi:hypothetical protein
MTVKVQLLIELTLSTIYHRLLNREDLPMLEELMMSGQEQVVLYKVEALLLQEPLLLVIQVILPNHKQQHREHQLVEIH